MRELAEGRSRWAIPWPVVHEFLCVVTRSRGDYPPTPPDVALGMVERWLASPAAVTLAEGPRHWADLRALIDRADVRSTLFYDARIAAICLAHGVRELWSADRDYGRFPALKVRNPLVG
jgi:predicted nucleic acid-binding protein